MDGFAPVTRQRLADALASRISRSIQSGELQPGERLPAIAVMARAFGVGAPTVRQALTKLEMMQLVDVRHGLGVYVRTPSSGIQRSLIDYAALGGD
jgi:GntR family transcriptional repressor for pyruvate dehydrogenase complex